MHFCVLLLPGSLFALLEGKPGLVLGGQEVEAHSLGCVQDLVDHLDLVSPPIAVLELCPAHVKLKAVASNVLWTPGTPLLGGDHAQHLLVRVRPLLVHIIGLARHFLEVAGSLVEESVQSCILKHLPCLLLLQLWRIFFTFQRKAIFLIFSLLTAPDYHTLNKAA